jgi:hypothetical protein
MRSIYSGRMSSFEPVSSAFAKLLGQTRDLEALRTCNFDQHRVDTYGHCA